MKRPKLLDLFCGAGGCAMGYHQAGFDVVGIDNKPQPRYPFTFIQGDAMRPPVDLRAFDAIHASPPCQAFSTANQQTKGRGHPDLVADTRELLINSGRPYVIENVNRAPLLRGAIMLCGLMFGLKVLRHRIFESSFLLLAPEHPSHRGVIIGLDGFRSVTGHFGGKAKNQGPAGKRRGHGNVGTVACCSAAMGIDWMLRRELTQAIPPAYTKYIGQQLLRVL